MQIVQQDEGLRDRKRRLAREATQKVAIELCLERGVDAVSVEAICERAGISPRSFYNYFGTREGALLGDAKPVPTEQQIEAFIARDDASDVEAFAALMAQVWAQSEPDRDLFLLRRRLLDATPELAAANWARINEARAVYAGVVRRRLEARRPHASDADLTTDAALVVALAMSMLQVLARGWAARESEPAFDTLVHDVFPRVRRLTQAAPAPHPTA
jgi:AcrR family transcriptional regulator